MYRIIFTILFVSGVLCLNAQQITTPEPTEVWEPEPRVVASPAYGHAPSDAIVLFDGQNLDEWQSVKDGSAAAWQINKDGSMTVKPGTGDIQTQKLFGDVQLHLEFKTPEKIEGEGQGRGNSGLFFQKRYEVQILDSYQNRTYSNGQCGAIYKQHIPLVNACRAPGQWQTYDIIFLAPVFNKDGMMVRPGRLTVLHNGVLIQNYAEIKGPVEYIGLPKYVAHGKDALVLQDHSNPVSYRNIWIREL